MVKLVYAYGGSSEVNGCNNRVEFKVVISSTLDSMTTQSAPSGQDSGQGSPEHHRTPGPATEVRYTCFRQYHPIKVDRQFIIH